MLVLHRESTDEDVFAIPQHEAENESRRLRTYCLRRGIQELLIDKNRTKISNTLFSFPYPGYDISDIIGKMKIDALNIHWIAGFQSIVTLRKIFQIGIPVVWTLHDQWAFTGGCHYSCGCTNYEQSCSICPQLDQASWDIPVAVLEDKKTQLPLENVTMVSPSNWLGKCARESSFLRDLPLAIIRNSVETDVYRPLEKSGLRKEMGIAEDCIVLLFGGVEGNERRKGFQELVQAIRSARRDAAFRNLVEEKRIHLACFGNPNSLIEQLELPVLSFGYLDTDDAVVKAYAAADLFVLPSLEDNLPNTMLESMSCGTPVLGFGVGGIREVIAEGVTGWTAPQGDAEALGGKLVSLVRDKKRLREVGDASRKMAERSFRLESQAREYCALYEELVEARETRGLRGKHRNTKSKTSGASGHDFMTLSQEDTEIDLGPSGVYSKIYVKAIELLCWTLHSEVVSISADWIQKERVIKNLSDTVRSIENDRSERLSLIKRLSERLDSSERDRAERGQLIDRITSLLNESEKDRIERGHVISRLSDQLEDIQKSCEEKDRLIKKMKAMLLREADEKKELIEMLDAVRHHLRITGDVAKKAKILEEILFQLRKYEAELQLLEKKNDRFSRYLKVIESDRAERGRQIDELTRQLKESEKDRIARGQLIDDISHRLDVSERDRLDRLDLINQLSHKLDKLYTVISDIKNRNRFLEETISGPLFLLVKMRRSERKYINRCQTN